MWQRVKSINFLTSLFFQLVLISSALVCAEEESGYKEALKYFQKRSTASPQPILEDINLPVLTPSETQPKSQVKPKTKLEINQERAAVSVKDSSLKSLNKRRKLKKNFFSMGLNYSNLNSGGSGFMGSHISVIQKTNHYLRQSLSLEYEEQDEIRNKVSFVHSLYYDGLKNWGPELGVGVGRQFDSDFNSSFMTLKMGLSFVDFMGGVMDIRVFFKQEVYFKRDLQNEGFGVSVFLKI